MKTYSIILAGGGGTRFWPLSRRNNPKQLLNLSGKDLMVNETINRLLKVVQKDDIFIVTNTTQVDSMKKATGHLINESHILSEPLSKNTSACIGYAAMRIIKEKGDGVIIVSPSDAYIKNEEEYAKILKKAVNVAEKSSNIVTIGIKPTFPSTGYGYIHF